MARERTKRNRRSLSGKPAMEIMGGICIALLGVLFCLFPETCHSWLWKKTYCPIKVAEWFSLS